MNNSKKFKRPIMLMVILGLSIMVLFPACKDAQKENQHIIKVTAVHNHEDNRHQFEMSDREISSGWTTFQFINASSINHFFLLYKVPDEGIKAAEAAGQPLVDHWFQGITEPYQMEFNPFIDGEIEYGEFTDNLVAAIMEKAPWFFDPGVTPMGGPGFTAAGAISKTTVYLEPGEYVVECYVKDKEELFHSYLGMLDHLSVTEEASGAQKPNPTNTLTISSTKGIQVDRELVRGSHIIELSFEDQASYAHLLGHNVQLVRLRNNEDEELLSNLATWMDWRIAGSLVDSPPEGAEFVGGTMEMTKGKTAYFHVDLEPGDYAWIAEVPNPADHGMLKTFTITD